MRITFVPICSSLMVRSHKQKVYSIIENRIGLNPKEYFMKNSLWFLDDYEILLNPKYLSSRVTRNFKFFEPFHTIYYEN